MLNGKRIVLVEDDEIMGASLVQRLELEGAEVQWHRQIHRALPAIRTPRKPVDAVICDIRLPDGTGEDLYETLTRTGHPPPFLFVTGQGSIDQAVRLIRSGALDYIAKPFDHDEMLQAVARILRDHQQAKSAPAPATGTTKASAEKVVDNSNGEIGIIGSCAAMQEMYSKIRKVAPTDSNVLIQGESGTGKELVARALHNLSRRAKAPLISVNCAAIPESLIESELFGHEKGAFTGASAGRAGLVEAADGGTLFLDEIGELPLEAQARLLRVLQEGEIRRVGSVQSQKVDVRLIAATHRDLKSLSKIGQFREDLYYRLHVIALKLPALRERGADVSEIARAFLVRQSTRQGRPELSFAADAEQAIRHYPWPGNVRELENAIERAVILCEGNSISAELLGIDIELDDLEDDFTGLPAQSGGLGHEPSEPTEDLSLEDYFQHFVLEHQDHMTETELARKLGISRKCLWERRQRLGIPRRKSSGATAG